jgi:hypothetical protein
MYIFVPTTSSMWKDTYTCMWAVLLKANDPKSCIQGIVSDALSRKRGRPRTGTRPAAKHQGTPCAECMNARVTCECTCTQHAQYVCAQIWNYECELSQINLLDDCHCRTDNMKPSWSNTYEYSVGVHCLSCFVTRCTRLYCCYVLCVLDRTRMLAQLERHMSAGSHVLARMYTCNLFVCFRRWQPERHKVLRNHKFLVNLESAAYACMHAAIFSASAVEPCAVAVSIKCTNIITTYIAYMQSIHTYIHA